MADSSPKPAGKPLSTKKEFLIFISIPVAVILFVSALLVGPSLFAKPKYDFIYSTCSEYSCPSNLQVNGKGMVTAQPTDNGVNTTYYQPKLYYYSASRNSSRLIDISTAQSYTLDSSNVSPDGYTLTSSADSSGFLFWGYSDSNNWYLKNGLKKKHLNLENPNRYGDNVTLLGWVKQ